MQQEGVVRNELNHLFRHESGKMVSVLTRIFGAHNIDLVEDVVQDTLLKALENWRFNGIPENPSGWLYTVAKNKALDLVRREKLRNSFSDDIAYLLKSEYAVIPTLHELFSEPEILDDQLRMMFVCCHPSISHETQVALILKTLCGFSTGEIASAFITNDEAVAKRIYRGKQILKDEKIKVELPPASQLEKRLEGVLHALYLLFNEGYSSSSGDDIIRQDLVDESLRLVLMLTENERTAFPKVFALAALIMLHSARLPSRTDDSGNILLLNDQDRSLWNVALIAQGIEYLNRSATGDEISIYHIQAAIAAVHSTAPSAELTDWQQIIELYDKLYQKDQSAVIALNRAIAIAQLHGPEAGLMVIENIPNRELLSEYVLFPATKGELYSRLSNSELARIYFTEAMELTHSPKMKKFLSDRIAKLDAE
jgi:RNA polymerase sigma factor (sigma-70 family)